MQPTSDRKRKSPLACYSPLIAIVMVVASFALTVCSTTEDDPKPSSSNPDSETPADIPVQFQAAEADGKAESTTWQDTCDTETGYVAMPVLNAVPCVPKFEGTPALTGQGITADTIRIGYYSAKPDLQQDALFKAAGAYDPPSQVQQDVKNYVEIYSKMYETYGRKIELVKIQGTGTATDEIAAKNDALTAAKQANVFAVLGGAAQARAFQETLAGNKVLCIGTCTLAAPQKFYEERSPYIWPTGPSIEQSGAMLTEMLEKQFIGKNAEYAGDEEFKTKKRTFALLNYDRNDGWYADSFKTIKKGIEDAGGEVVLQKSYFLDIAKIPQTAKDIAVALKQANATSVIFSGDPIMPRFFTEQSTDQGYFPEWIMAGTVLADTSVFGRTFDQQQWAHALGLMLTPARVTQDQNIAYNLHKWYFGKPPATENSFALTWGNVALLFAGIQAAGEKLTPENFRAGLAAVDPGENLNERIETLVTYGRNDVWPPDQFKDVAGLDSAGIIWWDPEAEGEDETGAVGKGMYRMVNGGRRFAPGQWPTEPIKLFDPAGTEIIYEKRPAELDPPDYPSPAGSPAAG